MDAQRLDETRARYERALEELCEAARAAEREIGAEALILLRLHGTKQSHHFFGSQFGSKTWLYAMHVHDPSHTAHFEVALGPNDPPTPVAGPHAEPERMLTFLQDAPALLQHMRQRVGEIHDNINTTGEAEVGSADAA